MLNRYNEFLFESKLNEFILEYSAGDVVEFDEGVTKYSNYLKNIITKLSLDKALKILNKIIKKVLNLSKKLPLKIKIITSLISIKAVCLSADFSSFPGSKGE